MLNFKRCENSHGARKLFYKFGIIILGIFVFPIVIFAASTTTLPSGYCFEKTLHPFTSDSDVKYLQIFLNENGFVATKIGLENYDYNIDTVLAIILFQEHFANEILTPFGLTAGTGNFGNITRKKVNDLLGCETIFQVAITTKINTSKNTSRPLPPL